MPFIDDILKHKSLSIVGTEKNTGKTVCLNYILKRLVEKNKIPAITSIGIDGESLDQVTNTQKPEIELNYNSIFVTSEKHFATKSIDAEILDVSNRKTSLGRLITARAKSKGKLIFSGPPETVWLKEVIKDLTLYKPDIVLVDGALSRKSFGSPSVTDSMILTTGAALSANMQTLVKKTAYLYDLIKLKQWKSDIADTLLGIESGLWAIDDSNNIHDLNIPSVFLLDKAVDNLLEYGNRLFISGVINDKILDKLRIQANIDKTEIIVRDFTRIFAGQNSLNSFLDKGGKIKVLLKTNLMAVCVNPLAPNGFLLDSEKLRTLLNKKLNLPVYDIKKISSEEL
ncbi:MAG: hypothetical protein PHP52_14640 [Bacteroidales bacterium]|nr:hypothetical protein [Bacteroidales bacterium]MDD4217834.1 hypothetical protein [Bacteroidales bacterium]MDY0141409.1 hypothetical protein [Bacteroidales bacterium]